MKQEKDINWKEIAIILMVSVALAVVLDALVDFSPSMKVSWTLQADANVTYQDLAATLLTAVAIILAVFGAFVAILAMRGYDDIKQGAARAAERHVQDSIADDGKLNKLVRKEAQEIIYKHLQGTEIPTEVINENSEYGD